MKVKEAIGILKQCDPEAALCIIDEGMYLEINEIAEEDDFYSKGQGEDDEIERGPLVLFYYDKEAGD